MTRNLVTDLRSGAHHHDGDSWSLNQIYYAVDAKLGSCAGYHLANSGNGLKMRVAESQEGILQFAEIHLNLEHSGEI